MTRTGTAVTVRALATFAIAASALAPGVTISRICLATASPTAAKNDAGNTATTDTVTPCGWPSTPCLPTPREVTYRLVITRRC